MFISGKRLKGLEKSVTDLRDVQYDDIDHARKRLADEERKAADLYEQLSGAKRTLLEIQQSLESLKSCRMADLADREPEKRQLRDFENRTIKRLGEAETRLDHVEIETKSIGFAMTEAFGAADENFEDLQDTMSLLAEAILSLIDAAERTPANGNARNKKR